MDVGIAMALAEADLRLLGRALVAEFVGAVCVLAVGLLCHLVIGSEILNRTAPSLKSIPYCTGFPRTRLLAC
jgi:hypothetical protein